MSDAAQTLKKLVIYLGNIAKAESLDDARRDARLAIRLIEAQGPDEPRREAQKWLGNQGRSGK